MKKTLAIFLIFFLTTIHAKTESQYKDFIVIDNFIWGLTSSGQIKLFDKANGKLINKNITNTSEIVLLVKDKLGNAIIADKDNKIKKWSEQQNLWEVISEYEGNIFSIVFNNTNTGFIIYEKGIQDLITKRIYFTDKSLNRHFNIFLSRWEKPYCYFIDKNDVIWLGFDHGEWGGNLYAFQTNLKSFLDLSVGNFIITRYPIKSFFEDSNFIYISASLEHMTTSGRIVQIDNNLTETILFESESSWSEPSGKNNIQTMIYGEYIGPATYNSYNNSIYFYSQNGFFCGDKSKDLSKIENWKLIVKANLRWRSGLPNAIGSPMNVLKITIIDKNKFIFLSENDGIGYFDGKKIKMLK